MQTVVMFVGRHRLCSPSQEYEIMQIWRQLAIAIVSTHKQCRLCAETIRILSHNLMRTDSPGFVAPPHSIARARACAYFNRVCGWFRSYDARFVGNYEIARAENITVIKSTNQQCVQ